MAGDGGLQIDGYNGDMMGMSLVWDIMGCYGMEYHGICWDVQKLSGTQEYHADYAI